jgi:predicted ATP-binding protein involved in virulence
MHLTRVQIPEFRALKNVDITFEKDFTPKIFPLGSENGGGKSTLLQLIFVLLHCASQPEKTFFIKNMLARYCILEGVNQQTLAKMDIWDGEKTVQIEFFCCNDDFLKSISSTNDVSFSTLIKESVLKKLLDTSEKFLDASEKINEMNEEGSLFFTESEKEKKKEEYKEAYEKYTHTKKTYDDLSPTVKHILECLRAEGCLCIETYSEKDTLLCRVFDFPFDKSKSFLSELSEKVFLIAPSTQICLFMAEEEKKLMLQAYQKNRLLMKKL